MDEPWKDFQQSDTNTSPWEDFGGGTTVAEPPKSAQTPAEPPPLTIPADVQASMKGMTASQIQELNEAQRPKNLWETANMPLTKTFTGKGFADSFQDLGERFASAATGGTGRTLTPEERQAAEAQDPAALKVLTGLSKGAADLADSFVTPLGIATLGLGALPKAVQRVTAAAFAAQMASQTPEQARELKKAIDEGDTAKATQLAVGLVGGAAMAAMGAKHAVLPEGLATPRITPKPFATPEALQPLADRINANVPRGTPTTEVSNASSEQKAAEVHGDVQPQPVGSAGKVPQPQGSGGVQSQTVGGLPENRETPAPGAPSAPVRPADAEVLTPAVRQDGKVYEAQPGQKNHGAIKLAQAKQGVDIMEGEHGFVQNGKFLTRAEAAKVFEDQTGKKPAKPGELHSEDLDQAGLLKHLDPAAEHPALKTIRELPPGRGKEAILAAADLDPTKPEQLDALIAMRDKANADRDAAMKAAKAEPDMTKKMAMMSEVAPLGQRAADLREAVESATGTGGSADKAKSWKPDYKPPFPKGKEAIPDEKEKGQKETVLTPDNLKQPGDMNVDEPAKTVTTPAASSPAEPAMAGPGSPHISEVPETGAGGEKAGIAERVRAEREQAGQTAPTQPGEGISAPDSVDRGRQLLQSGTDPEKVMSDFEKTKRLSADDMAVARAHGEALAKAARDAESKFGTDSDEYAEAWQRLSDWDARTKPMQTEWHKTGQAQQGETDLDTGSFTGLQRGVKEATGKDFTPKQAGTAKNIAAKVRKVVTAATDATKNLFDELKKKSFGSRAEKDAEEQAAQAVADWHRENAVRLAAAERKATTAEAAKNTADQKAAQADKDAATQAGTDRNRKAALDATKAEAAKAVKAADDALKAAKAERDALQKQRDKLTKFHRDAAVKAAAAERKRLDDPLFAVWEKVKGYIDKGVDDFDDIRNKVATDLGMKVDQVTRLMAQDNRVKRLSDDVWNKQQQARLAKQQAKQWVMDQAVPRYQRALRSIPRAMFRIKVGFHGTVALGTHAPMVAFQPTFWKTYAVNFGKMYKMVGSPAYYERQVQDLLRRPNYITARRAGLVNDPYTNEEYANANSTGVVSRTANKISPKLAEFYNKLTGMGNRGYSVLKILRQDMFDQQWNKLPKTSQIPEVASAIADGLNHATGVVKGKAPAGTSLAFFAPRLEGSRVMWLAGDPIRTGKTLVDWKNASLGEKTFAINQVKEKAWVAGTFFGMLALNQGILAATGSKQKVNMTDPTKSDFMKFKVAGMDVSYGNAMLSMARLPVRLNALRQKGGSGKLAKLIYPDESMSSEAFKYVRTQLSPFAGIIADVAFKGDYENRPLPKMPLSGAQLPMPRRLAARGEKPYTWKELGIDTALPIPAEEAVRDVWKNGLGMSESQIQGYLKAFTKAMFMAGTGSRVTDDQDAKKVSFMQK